MKQSALAVVAILISLVQGCSTQKEPRVEDPQTSNLRRFTQAIRLCMDFKDHAPRDEAELKKWLGEIGEPGTPEEFMISPRDGLPYVVCYNQPLHREGKDIILVYEQKGVEGTRMVLTVAGRVKTLTEAEFATAKIANN